MNMIASIIIIIIFHIDPFLRDELERFRLSHSRPCSHSASGRMGSLSPFGRSPRFGDNISSDARFADGLRALEDRPRTQQSSSSRRRTANVANSRSRSPSPSRKLGGSLGTGGDLVANWTRELTNELIAASECASKGAAISRPFALRSVHVPLRTIASMNTRRSSPPLPPPESFSTSPFRSLTGFYGPSFSPEVSLLTNSLFLSEASCCSCTAVVVSCAACSNSHTRQQPE
jgi:hypothetical protein